jgi:hypothetical protein
MHAHARTNILGEDARGAIGRARVHGRALMHAHGGERSAHLQCVVNVARLGVVRLSRHLRVRVHAFVRVGGWVSSTARADTLGREMYLTFGLFMMTDSRLHSSCSSFRAPSSQQ